MGCERHRLPACLKLYVRWQGPCATREKDGVNQVQPRSHMSVRAIGGSGALRHGTMDRSRGLCNICVLRMRKQRKTSESVTRADGLFASRLLWVRCASVARCENQSVVRSGLCCQCWFNIVQRQHHFYYGTETRLGATTAGAVRVRVRASGLSSERLSEQRSQSRQHNDDDG